MKKRLSYRKPKYKTAEQYGVSINKKMIEDMGISEADREVERKERGGKKDGKEDDN